MPNFSVPPPDFLGQHLLKAYQTPQSCDTMLQSSNIPLYIFVQVITKKTGALTESQEIPVESRFCDVLQGHVEAYHKARAPTQPISLLVSGRFK